MQQEPLISPLIFTTPVIARYTLEGESFDSAILRYADTCKVSHFVQTEWSGSTLTAAARARDTVDARGADGQRRRRGRLPHGAWDLASFDGTDLDGRAMRTDVAAAVVRTPPPPSRPGQGGRYPCARCGAAYHCHAADWTLRRRLPLHARAPADAVAQVRLVVDPAEGGSS